MELKLIIQAKYFVSMKILGGLVLLYGSAFGQDTPKVMGYIQSVTGMHGVDVWKKINTK